MKRDRQQIELSTGLWPFLASLLQTSMYNSLGLRVDFYLNYFNYNENFLIKLQKQRITKQQDVFSLNFTLKTIRTLL